MNKVNEARTTWQSGVDLKCGDVMLLRELKAMLSPEAPVPAAKDVQAQSEARVPAEKPPPLEEVPRQPTTKQAQLVAAAQRPVPLALNQRVALGFMQVNAGNYTEAVDTFNSLLKTDPKLVAA